MLPTGSASNKSVFCKNLKTSCCPSVTLEAVWLSWPHSWWLLCQENNSGGTFRKLCCRESIQSLSSAQSFTSWLFTSIELNSREWFSTNFCILQFAFWQLVVHFINANVVHKINMLCAQVIIISECMYIDLPSINLISYHAASPLQMHTPTSKWRDFFFFTSECHKIKFLPLYPTNTWILKNRLRESRGRQPSSHCHVSLEMFCSLCANPNVRCQQFDVCFFFVGFLTG